MEFLIAGVSASLQIWSPCRILRGIGLGLTASLCPLPWSELTQRLSPQASIVQTNDPGFAELASRWTDWKAPQAQAVVTVFSANDVAETVKYANKYNVPFLAYSSGHGMSEALETAKDAIIVNLRKMNNIQLSQDRHSATIGPGTSIRKIITELWAEGKQTVTGVCECVSISGPALGGGHGFLQGQHGLAIDQILSLEMITPEGDVITVSQDVNADLFWAMKGAGHNFGIVTEWHYKIYDVKNPKWPYRIFVFPSSQLEEVIDVSQHMMQTQAKEVSHWMDYLMIPDLDKANAVIWFGMSTDGPEEQLAGYTKKLQALGPIMVKTGEASLPDLASETFMGENDLSCQRGHSVQFYPIRVKNHSSKAAREVFDLFDSTMKQYPELHNSLFLIEGYSNHGVRAVDAKTTAYPHRDHTMLLSASPIYTPNSTIDAIAQEFSEATRSILLRNSDDPEHLNAYVNYAYGNEPVEAIYGWEPWRVERLRNLKAKWDPNNRMRFYSPLV